MWTVDLRLRLGLTSAGTGSQALSCTGTGTTMTSVAMGFAFSEKLAAMIVSLLNGGTCFLRGIVALEDIEEEVGWDDGAKVLAGFVREFHVGCHVVDFLLHDLESRLGEE